ncbi:hypothetical protein YC2023_076814 [Brassica napus]
MKDGVRRFNEQSPEVKKQFYSRMHLCEHNITYFSSIYFLKLTSREYIFQSHASMPVKNHKALDRRDQSSKRLTPHTYTKESKERREITGGGITEAYHREIKA